MTIKALDENLINKIAAGEVIERPASVVKELIENSIDAGATAIIVNIGQGGTDKIEVEDNGEGLSREDVPLAFQRHATSKIECDEDLFNISTMGFRGEALPSIASVSRIELFSKKKAGEGVFARLEGGSFLKLENRASPDGTRIIVRDLFFNTPARRNFLKSPVSEGGHIYELLCKYALARPDISFSFSNDKKSFFKTPGNGSLKDAVMTIYGRDFTRYMIEADYSGEEYGVQGLISTPELRRLNRKNQIFFINHRPVRSVLLFKAIDQAYQGRLLSREQPAVILSITVPAASVDVNVHPQKNEVRFKDEKTVFRTVHAVVKDCLEQVDYRPLNNYPFSDRSGSSGFLQKSGPREWQESAMEFKYTETPVNHSGPPQVDIKPAAAPRAFQPEAGECKIIGQCLDSYILLEKDGALYLVDQHAAHERIIYNRLKEAYAAGKEIAQVLAVPLPIELSGRQISMIEQNKEYFLQLGLDLDVIAPDSVLLRSAPPWMIGQELEIINELLEIGQDSSLPDLKDELIKTMACKKAVKAGDGLLVQEMETIIKDLFSTEPYKNCPHGRPTLIRMSHTELDRLFKR
ncbi:DNA mismatch repair endonuclease MutL [Syntrophomonas curvata]